MNLERINNLGILHKINLMDTAKEVLNLCDEHGIKETDIFTLASFIYYVKAQTLSDRIAIVSDFTFISKSNYKSLMNDINIDSFIYKKISEQFYKRVNARKALAFAGSSGIKIETHSDYMQNFMSTNYEAVSNEILTKRFINYLSEGRFDRAVELYFMVILFGRTGLLDKFSRIQRDKATNSFIYALNREIVEVGSLLIKNGKKIDLHLLSEESFKLSNEVVDEANKLIIELNDKLSSEIRECNESINSTEKELSEAKELISSLKMKISKYEDKSILTDLRVLVIGDTGRLEGYRDIIEDYGGIYDFTCGVTTRANQARRKALRSDIVFLITAHCHHEVTDNIKDFANIYWVNTTGLDSLEREIIKLRGTEVHYGT